MVARVFAVLAALFLVVAAAIAILAPANLSLGHALFELNRPALNAVQLAIQRSVGTWLWQDAVVPVLVRPAWLVPSCIALICAGLAMTLGTRRSATQSHRRRS
jgi:hypothetical protein